MECPIKKNSISILFFKNRVIRGSLKIKLKEIDEQLTVIRNKGRQAFLETQPTNFSRILHDYSDNKKGFIIWKDLLNEKLV